MARRLMIPVMVLSVMIVSLMTSLGGASAATSSTSYNVNAVGVVSGCEITDAGEVCTTVEIEAFNPSKFGGPATVCIAVTEVLSESGEGKSEEGCAEIADTFFLDERQQKSASLGPVSIDLSGYVCEGKSCDIVYTRTVTFAATWTGNANRVRINETQYGHQPSCDETVVFKGWYRPAAISASFNGESLSGDGTIQTISSRYRCR